MPASLLLNASYEPLRVVPRNRAIRLVMNERADVIESNEHKLVRAGSFSMPCPRVIRLRKQVNVPYRKAPLNRRAIFARDGHVCAYCGKHANTIDHVIPKAHGGQHTWTNIVAACGDCNARKGDKFLETLGWDLKIRPLEPAGSFWILIGTKEVDEAWEPYLPIGA